jgi:nucleoid-associated protein YgaU
MKIVRAIPIVLLACAASGLTGCQGMTFGGKKYAPADNGEVMTKLEAQQPAQERLPEIVSLPAPVIAPVQPVAPAVAPTTAFAAARPAVVKPASYDEPIASTEKPARHAKVSGHAAAAHGKTYVVKHGDTLQKISQSVYGTTKNWQKIFEANKAKLKKPDMIVVGMVLTLP